MHATLRLSFEDALRGGSRQVTVTRLVHCRSCLGTGHVTMPERRCQQCQGTGAVKSTRSHMVFSKPCAPCGGTGVQAVARCPECHGRQMAMLSESVVVSLPAGLHDGARIRLDGKGHAGANGGPAGDLYIAVEVEPHPLFRRDGDDLHLDRAGGHSRSGARRKDRRAVVRRSGSAAGAAGHAVGTALPAQRTRRAVAARRHGAAIS